MFETLDPTPLYIAQRQRQKYNAGQIYNAGQNAQIGKDCRAVAPRQSGVSTIWPTLPGGKLLLDKNTMQSMRREHSEHWHFSICTYFLRHEPSDFP